MNHKGNKLIELATFINIVLMFFGSYLGNLYIIQAVGLIVAIVACINKKILIKKDTIAWLIFGLVTLLSIIVSTDKYSSLKFSAMIIMAIWIKIIYENTNDWQELFINMAFWATVIHVVATIIQLIFPSFINSIDSVILTGEGLQMNQDLLKAGGYAGITAQTSVNAFFISVFVGITFIRILVKNEYKKINFILLMMGIIALFLTGKRAMLIITLITMILMMIYCMVREKKRAIKFISIILSIIIIGYLVIMRIPEAQNVIEKFTALEDSGDITNGRVKLWSDAIKIFNNNKLFGIGYACIDKYTGQYTHNVFLQVLAEGGIIGFFVFLVSVIYSLTYTIKKLLKIMKNNNEKYKFIILFSIFMQIIFIGYCFSGNPLYAQMFLIPYIISIAMTKIIKIKKGEFEIENRNNNISQS